jgi:hypothetical protein
MTHPLAHGISSRHRRIFKPPVFLPFRAAGHKQYLLNRIISFLSRMVSVLMSAESMQISSVEASFRNDEILASDKPDGY